MPKYICTIKNISSSATSNKEIIANSFSFTNNRVSFYDNDIRLIASYPSEIIIINKVENNE